MTTNEERREIAGRIRAMCDEGCEDRAQFFDLLEYETIGHQACCFRTLAERLADLIEPENIPEYAEWPKYEDGTPLRLGDELDFGDTCYKRARKVTFAESGVFISNQGGSAERVITLRKGDRLSKKIEQSNGEWW